jgi:hypothetical protein
MGVPAYDKAKDEFFLRDEYDKVKLERDGKGGIAKMVWQWSEGKLMTFTLVKRH